jgi:hypothetical protein
MFFRVFYEAARDLDSRPSPRADRVEACRPRECLLFQCSRAAGARGYLEGGREQKRRGPKPLEEPISPAVGHFCVGGAASHLSGLALCGSVPRLDST